MAALSVIGTILFILLFAVVPKLFGHGPDGVSASAGEGLRKMRIEGEIRALAAIYVLIYREVDEDRVQLAVADTAIDGR